MATMPKRSLKRTLASTVEDRTPRFLLGSLALAMVISLLAGLGIGMKVEQHRIKTKKAKPVAVIKPKPKPKQTPLGGLFASVGVGGRVFAIAPKGLILTTPKGRVPLFLVTKTTFEITAPAVSSDIVPGAHVVFTLAPKAATTTSGGNSTSTPGSGAGTANTLTAKGIVVVTGTSPRRVGAVVASVTANSMTFRLAGGKFLTVSTVGATILKTKPATRAVITKGRRVIVRTLLGALPKKKVKVKGRLVLPKRRVFAIDVVELPNNSAFG